MELKEGIYVRTDLGNIGKIVEEYTHQNNKVSYPEPQEWVLDTGYILNEAMMYKNEKIIKTSYNITDLIECLDIVELYIVGLEEDNITQIIRPETLNELKELKKHIKNGAKIKSITTREIFENMNYKVGE